MNSFTWLIRREIWEHRSFYLVPLVLVLVLTAAHVYASLVAGIPHIVQTDFGGLAELVEARPEVAKFVLGTSPMIIPATLLNAVLILTWFFYLVNTLYTDRKDRSVLFWKSLPVSDTQTVLSKLATAMLVLPVITLLGILGACVLLTISTSAGVATAGISAWDFVITQVPWVSGTATLVYGFVVQSLWYAPVFGWLLLASAFAQRIPALWAILPPVAVILVEHLVFNTDRFAGLLGPRLLPVVPTAFRDEYFDQHSAPESLPSLTEFIDLQGLLTDPGLWGGLVVGAVFVSAAVWLRRYRDAY